MKTISNRQQYVEYNDTKSDTCEIVTGVPQGSILGPLLFIIYINDISKATPFFNTIIYADDTTLLTHLQCTSNCINNINSELENISNWFRCNKLSINSDKSKFMLFHTPQRKVEVPQLFMQGSQLQCVNEFNFLGLMVHKNMKWDSHINKISAKISKILGILNRLKHFLPQNILLMLYNSLILPHIY